MLELDLFVLLLARLLKPHLRAPRRYLISPREKYREVQNAVVQNTDLLIIILPKINLGPAQSSKLHVSLLCQVVQNTGGPKIQNTDAAQATRGAEPPRKRRSYILHVSVE